MRASATTSVLAPYCYRDWRDPLFYIHINHRSGALLQLDWLFKSRVSRHHSVHNQDFSGDFFKLTISIHRSTMIMVHNEHGGIVLHYPCTNRIKHK